MKVRLVLWDIDGTLIRTGGAGTRAFERTFNTVFGIPRATETLNFSGRTDTSLVRECFGLHGIAPTPENFAKFFGAYPSLLEKLLQELPGGICEGVVDFMRQIQNLPEPPLQGLLTGNIRRGAELKLRHYRLWEHFQTGAFGDDHEDRNQIAALAKIRGEAFLKAELPGESVLVIGDTPLDIACGHSIGARVLAVGTGQYTQEQLAASKPQWAVTDLSRITVSEICG